MELYIDLQKALDTSRLVKKQVTVKGKNGIFTRMQWIDPHTGETVMEHHHDDKDEHHHKVNRLPVQHAKQMVSKYVADHRAKANLVGQATGMKRAEHISENQLTDHLLGNIDKIPMSHLDSYMKEDEGNTGEVQKPAFSFPSIAVLNPDMDKDKLDALMGYDVIPKEEMSKGTKILDSYAGKASANTLKKNYADLMEKVDTKYTPYDDINSLVDYILKDTTADVFEKYLSKPESGIHVFVEAIGIDHKDSDDEKTKIFIDFSVCDKPNPEDAVGQMSRGITRYHKDGRIVIDNDHLELDDDVQGKGWAKHLYDHSEAIWKHLGGGHHIQIDLLANISVGMYAWARKGFDFNMGEASVQRTRDELRTFCKVNSIDLDAALRKSGFSNLNEVKHTWQFANLTDGNKYDLRSCASGQYETKLEGAGHLGKAFLLAGKSHWHGSKHLNIGHITEKVAKGEL